MSDKYDANEDSLLSRDVIRELHGRLVNMAGAVLYSGRKLFAEAVDVPHRVYLQQGVDYDHFANEAPETAAEIALIPRPVLGCFGAMDFIMDTALMMEVAQRRPDWYKTSIRFLRRNSQNALDLLQRRRNGCASPVGRSQGPASDTASTAHACCDAAPGGFRSRPAAPYDTAVEPPGKQTPQSVVFGSESS